MWEFKKKKLSLQFHLSEKETTILNLNWFELNWAKIALIEFILTDYPDWPDWLGWFGWPNWTNSLSPLASLSWLTSIRVSKRAW